MNAKEKTSFILYAEYKEHLKYLSLEEKGMLFDALFEYVSDGTEPELSPLCMMAFSFIRTDIDQNAQKWEETKEKRSEAGKKGGIASGKARNKSNKPIDEANEANVQSDKANEANVNFASKNEANEAVNVNVNVNENVNENVNVSENAKEDPSRSPQRQKAKVKGKAEEEGLMVIAREYSEDEEFLEAILGFINMRKEKKKALSVRALRQLLKRLDVLAKSGTIGEKTRIVSNSVINDWQGVFALDEEYIPDKTMPPGPPGSGDQVFIVRPEDDKRVRLVKDGDRLEDIFGHFT